MNLIITMTQPASMPKPVLRPPLNRYSPQNPFRERREEMWEERCKAIFRTEPAWINICSRKGEIAEINPAGLEIMEAEDEAELLGKRMIDFAPPDSEDPMRGCAAAELAAGKVVKRELQVESLKGNIRWLEINSILLGDDPDSQILSIVVDQTERKHTEEELLNRQAELARVMRRNTLGEMASGLAHELNQPLAAIKAYVEGCSKRIESGLCSVEDFTYVMGQVETQIERAVGTLTEVRNFFRKDDTRMDSVNLNEIINSITGMLKSLDVSRDVLIKEYPDEKLPDILVNPVQIEQVILNLIRNALEALEEEGASLPTVEIHTGMEGDKLFVSVVDNGPGFDPEKLEEVFHPFYTTKKGGMGMGLSICRTIIEGHGGKIQALRNEDKGTTMKFSLPLHKEGEA
ncbi:MAG: sensor histidine kinase [Thiotrichales bacterium]